MHKQNVKHTGSSNKPLKITQPIPTPTPAPLNADQIKAEHYTREDILQLQSLYGNQAVQRFLKADPHIQRVKGDEDDPIDVTQLKPFHVNSSGGSRKFYHYEEDKLIAVPGDPGTVDKEVAALTKIASVGIKAVDAVKVYVGVVGKVTPAIKMSRLDGLFVDFKTENDKIVTKLIARFLNGEKVDVFQTEMGLGRLLREDAPKLKEDGQIKKTQLLKDLQKILDSAAPAKVGQDGAIVYDLQGIIGPDGSFVVIDPLAAETIKEFIAAMQSPTGKAAAIKAQQTYTAVDSIIKQLKAL